MRWRSTRACCCYTTAATAVVAVFCGVVPAFQGTRVALRNDDRTQASPRQRLQWLLVAMQVALSVTLLVGAGLLVRSLNALSRVDPGFDPALVLTFRVSGSFGEERDYNRTVQRINRTLDELAGLPGVEARRHPPHSQVSDELYDRIPGRGTLHREQQAPERRVSCRFSQLLHRDAHSRPAGRTLSSAGGRGWGHRGDGQSSIRQSLHPRAISCRVASGGGFTRPDRRNRWRRTRDGSHRPAAPTIYGCFSAATPIPWFLVRTRGEPQDAVATIRARLRLLEPSDLCTRTVPLEARIDEAYAPRFGCARLS